MSEKIQISKINLNNGQLEGVPKNPRFIRDGKFELLKKSIEEDPEMIELRELIVVPLDDKYVCIAGNMRLRALRELGYKEAPCKVIDYDEKKLRAIATKDNIPYGEWDWDLVANEWDTDELSEWGFEVWQNNNHNELTEDDFDINEEFDPIGISSGIRNVKFIFDGDEEAESYLNSIRVEVKKIGAAWIVDLSTQSI